MNHILLEWFHTFQDEPCLIYSEIDDQRYEVRKIEIYKNGTIARYDEQMTDSLFRLADVRFPENLDEINQYQEFCAKYISQEEFEKIWNSTPNDDLE